MKPARVAVVGAGLIGRRHIDEIARSASAALAAIVDPSPAARALATAQAVPHYPALDALLAADMPDGVVIATPNALHVPQALACIAAGVPALVEKPLAHTIAEAETLCDAVERSGVRLLVGHHRRHSGILHKAVEIIGSGVLGRLVGAMGSAMFYKPDAAGYYDGPNAWRRRPGGGPILINLIHEIDNLRAMVGEIVAVQAFASNATRGFEVEDTVAINLRFHNGALGTFLLSDTAASPRSWEQTARENAAYASVDDEDAYAIVGTRGSLGVPTMRLRTYGDDAARSWYTPFATRVEAVERYDPLARQIEHFVAVIRGEAQPLVSCRDGLQNLRVTAAIAQAAHTGQVVAIG
ncbi:MAG TPA: Gfo/Idh/MocA family oxidoreductase [Casimicrobiaceae bacterium]|nr:Gfo/Idh/MocA family oxidoreductase [Casimicrobiaceae bacterium]